MTKTLVLQDINALRLDLNKEKYIVLTPSPKFKPCTGCFNCWLKN